MRLGRQLDAYAVMRADDSTGDDDAHDPSLADQAPVLVAVKDRLHQPRLKDVQLITGIAQSGHLNDRVGTEVQPGAAGQAEEVQAAGGDVLAHLPRCDIEAAISQLVVELGMNEVDLPQVRLCRVGPNSGAMLHGHPGVRIVVHPDTGDKVDAVRIQLAECVHTATADGDDFPSVPLSIHPVIVAELASATEPSRRSIEPITAAQRYSASAGEAGLRARPGFQALDANSTAALLTRAVPALFEPNERPFEVLPGTPCLAQQRDYLLPLESDGGALRVMLVVAVGRV